MKKKFIDNGDGTVTDTETGLMWQKGTAEGIYTWENAMKYCKDLKLAGYSDWRLPNMKELSSLVDETKFNPAIDAVYFPDTQSSRYRSSSSSAVSTRAAWCVSFYDGCVNYYFKGYYYHVRAVRGGQKEG